MRLHHFVIAEFPTTQRERFRVLIIDSQFKKIRKIAKYLFSKLLWDELNSQELEAFLSICLKLNLELELEAFKALMLTRNKILIRKRVNALLLYLRRKPLSKRYWSSISPIQVSVSEKRIHRDISVPEKYSGWKRHQNDQGSLNPSKIDFNRQESTELILSEFDIITSVLSVGSLPSSSNSVDITSLMMALIKAETDKFRSLILEVFNEENL